MSETGESKLKLPRRRRIEPGEAEQIAKAGGAAAQEIEPAKLPEDKPEAEKISKN